MGPKRTGQGKYFLLFFACCIALIFGVAGCARLSETWKGSKGGRGGQAFLSEGERGLARAEALLFQGEYESALKAAGQVLESYHILGGEALSLMARIHAHPDNPNRNLEASLQYWRRVTQEFPESAAKEPAQVMSLFVSEIMAKEAKIGELTSKNRRLREGLSKEKTKSQELVQEAEALRDEVTALKDQLLRLKEIDLGIEEKKNQVK